jgi:branched-chain amino acid transport system permease protein
MSGDNEMTLFWMTFSHSHSALGGRLQGAALRGFWLAKRNAPELATAWHEANTMDGGAR